MIGQAALEQSPDPEPVLDALWRSPVAGLRVLALYRYQQAGGDRAVERSARALLDRSPSVRWLAQRFASGQGIDVRQAYLHALPGQVVALHGLAEVATAEDLDLIESYLGDERPAARAAAVLAVGRLGERASRPVMLRMLDDPSRSVVRAAGRVLGRQHLDPTTLDELWNWLMRSPDLTRIRVVFAVSTAQSAWPKLVLAGRSLLAADEEVRRRGAVMFDAVMAASWHLYTRPSGAQRDELQAAAAALGDARETRRAGQLAFLLRTHG